MNSQALTDTCITLSIDATHRHMLNLELRCLVERPSTQTSTEKYAYIFCRRAVCMLEQSHSCSCCWCFAFTHSIHTRTHTPTHPPTHTHTRVYTRIHTQTHTHTHTHTHRHTHTHIHTDAHTDILIDPEFEDARDEFCKQHCIHFEVGVGCIQV